ncbi:MAG TPA: hypothetical protein DCS36_00530 [Sphingobacterium sp.]|nr:hypothetical protein [Sphingobacterium sp.]
MINLVYLTHVAMAVQLEHAVTLFYATGNASKYASPLLKQKHQIYINCTKSFKISLIRLFIITSLDKAAFFLGSTELIRIRTSLLLVF